MCGDRTGQGVGRTIKLVAHHLAPWSRYTDVRFDIENGLTLCGEDHQIVHRLFGYSYNLDEIYTPEFIVFGAIDVTEAERTYAAQWVREQRSVIDREIAYVSDRISSRGGHALS